MHCFPRAVKYLDTGKIKVKGMVSKPIIPVLRTDLMLVRQVTDVFSIAEFQQAMDKMTSRDAVKIAIKPH